MPRARKGEAQRFLLAALDTVTHDCIVWPYSKNALGYGTSGFASRTWLSHRLVYFLKYGAVPSLLRHTCDNPACVNVQHLMPGSNADNMRDMVERGRQCKGEDRATKLTGEQVQYIRANYVKGKNRFIRGNGHELAAMFKVTRDYVHELATGDKKWQCLKA